MRASILSLILLLSATVNAQDDLQKLIEKAKQQAAALQKQYGQNQQTGLPAGADNSWKIKATVSRTVTGNTDVLSKTSACKDSKKISLSYNLQSDLSTEKMIGTVNGDDFNITTQVDDNLKSYIQPLKGSFNITASSGSKETSCDQTTTSKFDGGTLIDPSSVSVSFHYNKKSKQGDFQISLPQDYTTTASGKMTITSKNNPPFTTDISELGKAQINALTAVCGIFQSWNYNVSDDASIQQQLNNSPVNGGQASIGETKYGYTIDYSESKTITNNTPGWEGADELTYTTNVHILITNQNPPTLEAILDPVDDYKNFIPEGPKMDGKATEGNSLTFRVRIIDKKNGDKDVTVAHPFSVTYLLDHVSKYKGMCMNYPKQNADEKPDLRWGKIALAESHLKSSTENTLISNTREGDQLLAYITSYDYAAYGILKAHVHLDNDDLDLEAHLKDKPDEPYAIIPVDDNQNKIADKWEKDIGIFGKSDDPDFDEDEFPNFQRRNGDGYTLFEEYRGFKVNDNILPQGCHETFKNSFIRMNPNYKDIFINDVSGLFKQYYEPYNPSNLCWHYIDKDEMIFNASGKDPQNRWVNFNKCEHFYANQYALIMEDKPAESGDAVLGQQLDYNNIKDFKGSADDPKLEALIERFLTDVHDAFTSSLVEKQFGFDQPVKNTIIIDVYTGKVTEQSKYFKPDKQQGAYTLLITGVINHEIGHALGITHHRLESGAETDESKVSGVINCSMRYLSNTETGNFFLVFRPPHYCRDNETWKEIVSTPVDEQDPGKAVPLKTITHPSNNCYGQIDVKSDP